MDKRIIGPSRPDKPETKTQILAEILNHPEVKKILKDFIGGESIGATDDDLEVYYPDEEEG